MIELKKLYVEQAYWYGCYHDKARKLLEKSEKLRKKGKIKKKNNL